MVFSLISNVCAFLQKGPPGPPQPQRQRAPPAMMPREVEAHPKLNHGMTSEGGAQTIGGMKRCGTGKACPLVVLIQNAFTH